LPTFKLADCPAGAKLGRGERGWSGKAWNDCFGWCDEGAGIRARRRMTGPIAGALKRYRVADGAEFRLKDHDPADTGGLDLDADAARDLLAHDVARLAGLQARLYADNRWSLLCVFQAMDAAGKDGTIKHVMSGVNPQGVQVSAFKAPGPEELAHDFLWRVARQLPERGRIGVFNRSHYEEVLVVRVHPEFLERQRLPDRLLGKRFWRHRLEDIAAFERYLARQGTVVLKFFLHVSKEEQKRRLLARLDEPDKNWKFNPDDLAERARWDDYMDAYERAIAATAAPHAPWYVVPADHKWFAHLVVVAAMIEALQDMDLHFPALTEAQRQALEEARRRLEAEG
jgi:PPK2 family polyphosphate:nucleotide phosphotransferase